MKKKKIYIYIYKLALKIYENSTETQFYVPNVPISTYFKENCL